MKCSRCAHESPQGARFCEECATPLARNCARCETALSPTAKFCHACGQSVASSGDAPWRSPESYTPTHIAEKIRLSKAALEGERKQVTVLFADLKGSMELLADRDPEEARKILDPVLELMMEAVHRYEGTVNQVMGDGIMALFGAPIAHEDHAIRACYAALDMQTSIHRYAEQARHAHGVTPEIRVGLNSGEVVVRAVGSDLRMDYSAVGQTTHLAARMEQLARAGTTLLTADTLRLAEGFVTVKPLGPVPIKGREGPVEIHELIGPGLLRSRLHVAAARGLTRFVGRSGELEQLWQALSLAAAGHGQIVAVVGEPGVGKSRLVWEVTHSHRTHGWLVLQAASVSYGKASTYLPVIELLKGYCQIEDRDDPRKVREKVTGKLLALDDALQPVVPAILALLDLPVEGAAWQTLDPPQRRQRTLDAVKRVLVRETQVQPLLVVFEDLHWIDSETQAVLDTLAESVPATRMLLLVNYRPEYEHRWSAKTYYKQLRLDPLPIEGAEELLQALLGNDVSLVPLARLLIDRTEGNPFFLEESVRTLVETGVLVGERGAYRLVQRIDDIRVPPTIQTVLTARIDRLSPEEKTLLQTAAVIGKDVPFELLRAILSEPDADLRRHLARLQAAEFLYETALYPDPEYTFKHALTHEVAYGNMLQERRRILHGRIVGAIERAYHDRLIEHVERLAHHSVRAELWGKAALYLRQAGARALGRSAYREATGYLEQALSVLGHLPGDRSSREQAVDVRLDLYSALLPLGELRPLLEYLRQAETLAAGIDDRRRLGWARLHVCHLLVLIDEIQASVKLGHDVVAMARAQRDTILEAVALLWVGCGSYALGEPRRGVTLLRDGLSVLGNRTAGPWSTQASLPDVLVQVTARSYQSMFLAEIGEFAEALAIGREGMEVAQRINHPWNIVLAYWQVGSFHLAKGELEEATRLLQHAVSLGREWGSTRSAAMAACGLGYALALSGRAVEGIDLVERGMRETDGVGMTWLRGRHLTYLGESYLLGGRHDEAGAAAAEALTFSRQRKERGFEAWALRLLGEIASQPPRIDVDAAERSYSEALSLATELGMHPLVAHCHLGLGKLYRRAGKPREAQERVVTATTMYREMGMTYWLGRAS